VNPSILESKQKDDVHSAGLPPAWIFGRYTYDWDPGAGRTEGVIEIHGKGNLTGLGDLSGFVESLGTMAGNAHHHNIIQEQDIKIE